MSTDDKNKRTIKKDPIFGKQATLLYRPEPRTCLVQPSDSYIEESYWLYIDKSSRYFFNAEDLDAEIENAGNHLSAEEKEKEAKKIRQVNRENRENRKQGINKHSCKFFTHEVCLSSQYIKSV